MGADLKFYNLGIGESVRVGEVLVENALLNHPGESVGYRISWRGLAVAYITDTEHFPEKLDENVLQLAHQADVLIYDATYTDEEYYSEKSSKVGWGHSTWQEAVKVAKAAKVKKLVIFHHDPLHDDSFMDQVKENTARQFPNSIVAWEGLEIDLLAPLGLDDPTNHLNTNHAKAEVETQVSA
jgi:phosphoribosyl 1,2-cyclic phosphodiesterase